MKKIYIEAIVELLNNCEITLLLTILKILQKQK